ncbi:MAG: PEGA domain-containing protein [Myxococcales bacterium]|nr:PEGA domain-containing protein [Myxococcales bacterium]
MARGTIFVNTLPWARVDLDGVYIGNTPISGRAVAAGEHRLRLTTDEGQVYEVTLNVNPGANTRLVYRF